MKLETKVTLLEQRVNMIYEEVREGNKKLITTLEEVYKALGELEKSTNELLLQKAARSLKGTFSD